MKTRRIVVLGLPIAVVLLTAVLGLLYLESKNSRSWPDALREQLGAPEYESIDPSRPLNEQTSVFEIAGRTFEMPKVYIQTNLGDRRVIDGINLLYVLPNFTSRVDFVNRGQYEQARADGRLAHMHLEPETQRRSFDATIESLRSSTVAKEECVGALNGLEYCKWFRDSSTGLVFDNEIYLERDSEGNIASYIECAPRERGAHIRFPGCSHIFRDKGLLYDIYYNKANYFSTWREQRRRAIEFIDGFEKSEAAQ